MSGETLISRFITLISRFITLILRFINPNIKVYLLTSPLLTSYTCVLVNRREVNRLNGRYTDASVWPEARRLLGRGELLAPA